MNEPLVVVVRSIIAFFSLFVFTRILGKQQISQLTYFDYILGITIGSIAATLSVDLSIKAWPQWVGLLVWTVLVIVMELISLKWRYISKFLEGEPAVVVMNGQIMENTLKKLRIKVTEILELLRSKGVFDVGQVEFAVLETSGKISVQKKSQFQPVTPSDLNLSTDYKGLSTEIIYDGVIIDNNLEQVHLDRSWLDKELKKQGIDDYSEVFLALLDTGGSLYVDKYKDHVKSPTDPSDYPGPN
ncbi:MAG: DUF421 domain-containing protein [Clostridiales bacterium]|nr:DUF421 domain-containing protein [Clostridiales bacterium]MCF8023627.1 DUF421 domain-containing protein [Clostridiales bacterium]